MPISPLKLTAIGQQIHGHNPTLEYWQRQHEVGDLYALLLETVPATALLELVE
jgi:hypothetical protein